MNDNHANYLKIGFVVILGIVATFVALVYLGGLQGHGDETLVETYCDKPVGGLSVGSPVNFRGVKIGEVRELSFVGCKYDVRGLSAGRIYILMAINNRSLGRKTMSIDDLIRHGLRAMVASNGITGLSRIEIDLYEENATKMMDLTWKPKHLYIPPQISLLDNFADSATKVMNQINNMDLNSVWTNVTASIEALSRTLNTLSIMIETRHGNLEKIVDDVSQAVEDVRDTAAELKRNPSLLIRERVAQPLPETR